MDGVAPESDFDRRMMRKALSLAARGRRLVSPNPMVGAVVVKDGQVTATGFHHRHGAPHAEIDALAKLGFNASGHTLYVNLEPCCHHGMTPPCANSVVSSGISRVVIGTEDPNPLVSGRGIETLVAAGLEVTTGVLADECRELNRSFFKWISTGRPFVTLKMASTIDGCTADREGSSRWITGPASRKDVHRMRAVSDCVMVGAKTAALDDPLLLPTLVRSSLNPLRVVVSGHDEINVQSALAKSVESGPVLVVVPNETPATRIDSLRGAGLDVLAVDCVAGRLDLVTILDELGARRVTSVLVEGGSTLAASLVEQSLIDRLVVYQAPSVMCDRSSVGMFTAAGTRLMPDLIRFRMRSVRRLGDDIRMDFDPVR